MKSSDSMSKKDLKIKKKKDRKKSSIRNEKKAKKKEVHRSTYVFSIYDPRGDLAFDLGVTGAPESYLLIDNQVVASIQGEMTPKKWETIFYPLINQARNNK